MKGRATMKTTVTTKVFDAVKLLLESGAKYEEVSKFFNISHSTIGRINKAQDFAEYKHMTSAAVWMAKRDANKAKREAEKPKEQEKPQEKPEPILTDLRMQGGTISANYQINRMYELLKKQTETLTLISNKLAFIVCELGGGKDDAGGSDPKVS